jgi:hypothetical protein
MFRMRRISSDILEEALEEQAILVYTLVLTI